MTFPNYSVVQQRFRCYPCAKERLKAALVTNAQDLIWSWVVPFYCALPCLDSPPESVSEEHIMAKNWLTCQLLQRCNAMIKVHEVRMTNGTLKAQVSALDFMK